MNKNALVCEDSLTTACCIKAMLEKLNYYVDTAQSAKEALEFLRKNQYDLMTLDILLPDKSGLDLLEEMKSLESATNMPIIVISATKKESAELKFENNIIYWLEKSFDIAALETAIENVMKQKNKNKIEILHVENDEDLLNLIEVTLNDIANVTPVNTLIRAKELIAKKKFDIIILDYVFPEGTCDKLIPSIKSGKNKDTKLIMFSSYEENKTFSKIFDKIIIKTNVSFDEFKTCIEKFIVIKDKTE